jgi:hypothetical protein
VAGDAHVSPSRPDESARPPNHWKPIFPYGYTSAVEAYGAVAASLLAGFSVSLIGLVLASASSIRWSDTALLLLAVATVLFIAAMQFSQWARQFAVTPDEIRMWQPEYEDWRLYAEQWVLRAGFTIWNKRFRDSFRLGVLAFLAGISTILVPPDPVSAARWGAIGIAAAGLVAEALWITSSWVLAGSPIAAYNDQPDSSPPDASPIRKTRAARWIARKVIPLPRVDIHRPTDVQRPADEKSAQGTPN